jgi:hypothetical protein
MHLRETYLPVPNNLYKSVIPKLIENRYCVRRIEIKRWAPNPILDIAMQFSL